MQSIELPYFLTDFPGIGGRIKDRPEDFFVQEIPLYEPTGDGDHVMAEVQKVGVGTLDANDYIARALNVDRRNIGYAGLKDAQAVTRQIITIPFVTPEQVMAIKSDRIVIQWAAKHRSKIRMGHLAGNRFAIKVRDVDPMKVVALRPALDTLARRGVPNYFGEQRFGQRNNNDLMGAAFVRGDDKEVLRLLLGDPRPGTDKPEEFAARTHFSAASYEQAIQAWPRWAHNERRALARFIKSGDSYQAVMAVDMPVRRLWVTAMQSRIFNEIVSQRIGNIDQLITGDLAYKHENGSHFAVEDAALEQPRADAFEISPTGPMIGRRMSNARGRVFDMERALFDRYRISARDFRSNERDRSHGDRRPLRVQPKETKLESGVDEHGAFITIAFTLPRGAYATILLRELMKNDSKSDAQAGQVEDFDADSDE
ncbi:MAG: tRNA pseudouridine(13) synthase TruD [Burkholderiales bacterium]|nr:tRNA pseudouridine(13) synthase TruD [Phycisphaerae bacterium]